MSENESLSGEELGSLFEFVYFELSPHFLVGFGASVDGEA